MFVLIVFYSQFILNTFSVHFHERKLNKCVINERAKAEICQILQMIWHLSGCFFLREDCDWMGSSGWSRHLLKWNTCLDVCPSTFRRWDQPVDLSLTFKSHVTSLISWLTSAHYVELQYVSEKNFLCWTTSAAIYCISNIIEGLFTKA